jgi:hypothetical protein
MPNRRHSSMRPSLWSMARSTDTLLLRWGRRGLAGWRQEWIARSRRRCLPRLAAPRWIRPSGSTAAKNPPLLATFPAICATSRGSAAKTRGIPAKSRSKNGGKRRFFEGQSAISTPAYAREAEAQPTGMPGLTFASGTASCDPPTDNSKTERHFRRAACDPTAHH